MVLIAGSLSSCFSRSHSTASFLTFKHLICGPRVALLRSADCWLLVPGGFQFHFRLRLYYCVMCLLSELLSLVPEKLFVVLPSQVVNIPFILFQSTHGKMQIRVEKKLCCNTWVCAIPEFVHACVISSNYRLIRCQSELILPKEKLRLTISREVSENWNLLVFCSYSHPMTFHFRNTLPGIRRNDCSTWRRAWGNLKIAVPRTVPWGSGSIAASLSTV